MAVLYSLIGKVIFKKVNFSIKDKSKPKSTGDAISTEMFSTQSPNIDKSIVSTDVSTITTNSLDGKTTAVNLNSHKRASIHHWRITLVFNIVTITFAVSFIPKVTMMVIESVSSSFWLNMSEDELGIQMFLYSIYIFRNFSKPVIYNFLDKKFQIEVKNLCCFRKVWKVTW